MTNRRTVRVVLGDHEPHTRQRLAATLAALTAGGPGAPSLEVVGEAATGEDTARLASKLRPDVVIMDLMAPELGGIDAVRRIRAAGAVAGIVVLATPENAAYIPRAVEAGAIGVSPKDAAPRDLLDAVRSAARGRPTVDSRSQSPPVGARDPAPSPFDTLTPTEADVLRLIANGKSNKETATALQLTVSSVRGHINQILAKLGVVDRTQALEFAASHRFK
jgi:DNA-binding NarL/FixJ family response regulator